MVRLFVLIWDVRDAAANASALALTKEITTALGYRQTATAPGLWVGCVEPLPLAVVRGREASADKYV